jgi:hypothetical protein
MASVVAFGLSLWLAAAVKLSFLPKADADRWVVNAAFATAMAACVVACGAWWAGRENRPGSADGSTTGARQQNIRSPGSVQLGPRARLKARDINICAVREVPIPYLTTPTDRQSERQLVFALLTWLDGRRVLFDPWTLEDPERVAASVLEVRARIDDDLASLEPDAEAIASLRAIRAACLQYLTRVPHSEDAAKHWPGAINDLRAGVGKGIESLERDYKIATPGGTGREELRVIYVPVPEEHDPSVRPDSVRRFTHESDKSAVPPDHPE